ncbi:MAG: 3-hydroxylacyl-ACP dehydratase [Sneathiella sp.]
MVLLDRFVAATESALEAEVHITEGSPFYCPEKGVPAYVGIEYIAQAISAYNGLLSYQNNEKIELGFLLGSRRVDLKCAYFPVGSILSILVNVSFNDGEMAVFDGTIILDGQAVVTGRINAYQPKNPRQLIKLTQE